MAALGRAGIGQPRRHRDDRDFPIGKARLRRLHHARQDGQPPALEFGDTLQNVVIEIAASALGRRRIFYNVREDERGQVEPFAEIGDVVVIGLRGDVTLSASEPCWDLRPWLSTADGHGVPFGHGLQAVTTDAEGGAL